MSSESRSDRLKSSATARSQTDGTLLGILSGALYLLFTLLPNSHSMMVSWPWVFLWQVAVGLPMLWLLWQLWQKPWRQLALGHGLDWVALLAVVGLGVSTLGAEFAPQARWYGWAALGGMAALYALRGWLSTPQRCRQLLFWQGGIGALFILESLGLWLSQIYWPERQRLATLQQYGIDRDFSFQLSSLQNWLPIGHQNYGAGYLVLVLPLLVGLSVASRGLPRWLWAGAAGLGLLTLYTTSSRAGWLALVGLVVVAIAIALGRSALPRRVLLPSALGGLVLLVGLAVANDRLRSLLGALLQGQLRASALDYRVITHAIGWQMGATHLWSGLGLGGVPLSYQAYRPFWAGREAELQYQLHGTVAQLWAELGLWGILVPLGAIALGLRLAIRWLRSPHTSALSPPLVAGLLGGLLAYGLVSLTDYQLDNLCISGTLVLYLAVLISSFDQPPTAAPNPDAPRRLSRGLSLAGMGLFLAVSLGLVPVHRAWAHSSEGFAALAQDRVEPFVQRLTTAHALAPWEPYYSYQLGWNLGELSDQVSNAEQASALRNEAIAWFQAAIAVSPYREFGYSNLGWLQLQQSPEAAVQSFARSAQLVPAKTGIFFGLGLGLLRSQQPQLVADALVLELLRHPLQITSPAWQAEPLAAVREPVMVQLERQLTDLIEQTEAGAALSRHWHQVRGSLRWWRGDTTGAAADWRIAEHPLSQGLLAFSGETTETSVAAIVRSLPQRRSGILAMQAWLQPDQRRDLLTQAWVAQPEDRADLSQALPNPAMIDRLVASMEAAESFEQWLKQRSPTWEPRNQRLGFGVLSRHIDGPQPADYFVRVENVAMVKFFEPLLRSPTYFPELDRALQPLRDELLQAIRPRS